MEGGKYQRMIFEMILSCLAMSKATCARHVKELHGLRTRRRGALVKIVGEVLKKHVQVCGVNKNMTSNMGEWKDITHKCDPKWMGQVNDNDDINGS